MIMFTQLTPQLLAAKSGSNRSNTLYLIRHPSALHSIERIPETAVVLIGPVRPALAELLSSTSRAQFQKLLPLSANAHSKLQTAVIEKEPGEAGKLRPYGDLQLVTTGDSTGRIDLIFGRGEPVWQQIPQANMILVNVSPDRLHHELIQHGPEIKEAFQLSVSSYRKLRRSLGIVPHNGRPKKPQ